MFSSLDFTIPRAATAFDNPLGAIVSIGPRNHVMVRDRAILPATCRHDTFRVLALGMPKFARAMSSTQLALLSKVTGSEHPLSS
jgi:hypothetical protein